MVTALDIVGRTGARAAAGLSQFVCERGERVDAASLASNPYILPFGLDHGLRKVILAETRPGVDLFKAPFCYVTQAENAVRLFLLDHSDFQALAEATPIPPRPTTVVHSIARSGSTLAARILDAAGVTATLCEPGLFHDAAIACRRRLATSDDLVSILRACFRFSFRHCEKARHFVLKLRHSGLSIAAPLHNAIGDDAAEIFVYRNAVDSVESMARHFMENERREACATDRGREALMARDASWLVGNREDLIREAPVAALFSNTFLASLGPLLPFALLWLGNIDLYLAARRRGSAIAAFRYDTLLNDPEGSIRALFDHVRLEGDAFQAMRALAKDSQEGTLLARDTPGARSDSILRKTDVVRLGDLLRSYEPSLAPDTELPATLNVAGRRMGDV